MGLFDKLLSKLTGGTEPSSSPQPAAMVQPRTTAGIRPSVEVSDIEVAERVREYAFVLTTDPPALKTVDQWWNEDTQKRRRREGSDKAYAWLLPFVPVEIAKLKQLHAAQQLGPHGAGAIAKNLRALVRERRKAKARYQELLQALYGACVADDLFASLEFEGVQSHYMARFVDIKELHPVVIDFRAMGYLCIESLSKTDVKWLVEAFGEPTKHASLDSLYPHVRRNAVARYCWSELRSSNNTAISRGLPQKTMQEWLNTLVRRNISYFKEWQQRVAKNQAASDIEPGADFRFQEDPDTLIRVKFKKPARATQPAMIFRNIPVVGASQLEERRNIALFITGIDRSLRLERDRGNQHDKNAIRVMGAWKGRNNNVTGSGQLGWVPREIAAEIAEDKELRDMELLPTLRTMYLPSAEKLPGLRFDIWLGEKLDQANVARSVQITGNRFEDGVPCSDESCTGIIGPTGRCGTCGKKYKG